MNQSFFYSQLEQVSNSTVFFTVNFYGKVNSTASVASNSKISFSINNGFTQFVSGSILNTGSILLGSASVQFGDSVSIDSVFNEVNSQYIPYIVKKSNDITNADIEIDSTCGFQFYVINQNEDLVIGALNDNSTFCDYS